jgi:Mrp family chromosome partitioning ATPase
MESVLRGADEGPIMRADLSHPRVPSSGLNRQSFASGAVAPAAPAMVDRVHSQPVVERVERVESRIHFDLHEEEMVTDHSSVNGETAVSFQAAWEVDRFEFADIVWELSDETSPLWLASEQLQTACQEGLKVMVITSPGSEQGRSTLSIVLARMLAASGLNVLLLDGDLERPSLADKLSLDVQMGWSDAIRTGISPEEVAVHSVEDGFTVLPLAVTNTALGSRQLSSIASRMVGELRLAFDLIIIDAAQMNVSGAWIPGTESPGLIDAALVIQDLRQENPAAMQTCLQRLSELGIENVGLVENFSGS